MTLRRASLTAACLALVGSVWQTSLAQPETPSPLLRSGEPVDWWFEFKFNGAVFPNCEGDAERVCRFGGNVQSYRKPYGLQFVYASSADHSLKKGTGCAGEDVNDPLGATFDEMFDGQLHYIVWNDQFYDDPIVKDCKRKNSKTGKISYNCFAPWGHSKGMLAWDDSGNGLVLQVSTPSWPGSGNASYPRAKDDGNTLGCVHDNDVEVSQDFFALKLDKEDVEKVVKALDNASVVTNVKSRQVVNNGGPPEISELVKRLGKRSVSKDYSEDTLSSGVILISKPSKLFVPPWQMVSSVLGGIPLRTATWWDNPKIYSTHGGLPKCWSPNLAIAPGAVEIATSGQWDGTPFDLKGGIQSPDRNHAKIGVSTDNAQPYVIFGDMNQQGTLVPAKSSSSSNSSRCTSSQNGRGGLFFAIEDAQLAASVSELIKGDTAPDHAPASKAKK